MENNMNERKYPIVYAILPLRIPTGRYYFDEPIYEGPYYIVSKAFLFGSGINYNYKNSEKNYIYHEVLFPYPFFNCYEDINLDKVEVVNEYLKHLIVLKKKLLN